MPYDTLAEFFVNAPLYRAQPFAGVRVQRHQNGNTYLEVPQVVERECEHCGRTKWQFDSTPYAGMVFSNSLTHVRYKCRNCDDAVFSVWIMWYQPNVTVVKAGQHPKPEITIPKEFGDALGDKRPLYVKGMTMRHNNYGIGALTYFRRVIEDTTDEMLDLLETAMVDTQADPDAIETLRAARTGTRFEDKVKIAGEVMPQHLRPGGINPFGNLYALLSIGLHDRTDEECCEIVDAMDESIKFIYTRLKTHMEASKAYESSTQKVGALLAKMKKSGPG